MNWQHQVHTRSAALGVLYGVNLFLFGQIDFRTLAAGSAIILTVAAILATRESKNKKDAES